MQNQTRSQSHGVKEGGRGVKSTLRARGTIDGSPLSELMRWDGNIVMAAIQQVIYESPMIWFGCHWDQWPEIAHVSCQQYFDARHRLVGEGKMRVVKTHIPRRRKMIYCHTLHLDADPPEPGVNLWIWGMD